MSPRVPRLANSMLTYLFTSGYAVCVQLNFIGLFVAEVGRPLI